MIVITFTLNPAAANVKVLPVVIVLVAGARAEGVVGELLAVAAPVRTCRLPDVATLANGRTKVRLACAATVLET